MLAVGSGGLIVLGPEIEASIAIDGGTERAGGLAAAVLSDHDCEHDVQRLRRILDDLGALGEDRDRAGQSTALAPLGDAIAQIRHGEAPVGLAATAEEAIYLPATIPAALRVRAARAFVAGIEPRARLRAYGMLMRGDGAVHGDRPIERVGSLWRDAVLGERKICVLTSSDPSRPTGHVDAHELDRLGAERPHRLGTVTSLSQPRPVSSALPGTLVCIARIAAPDPEAAGGPDERLVQGTGATPSMARWIACAEGAERHSAAYPATGLRIARAAELRQLIAPTRLYARRGFDAGDGPRAWRLVRAIDGRARWAPAECIHTTAPSPHAPSRRIPWTGSGVAAALDPRLAARHAVWELIERDAFMVTWLRRAGRERIGDRDVPEHAARMRRVLGDGGWSTVWVNISLDTLPVILCCLTHPRHGLRLGAACRASASQALERATVEAVALACATESGPPGETGLTPGDVRSPSDHLQLHADPARAGENEFLYASRHEIELSAIPTLAPDDVPGALADAGCSPLTADLSSPRSAPYAVVRALAPGLVPLTFGFGAEPDAMPRVREGVATRDGHIHGHAPRTGDPNRRLPHPFA